MTVPGVGKLQGSIRPTQWTGRDVYSFFGIPFGEDTGGEHRFAPPRPHGQLNDGKVRIWIIIMIQDVEEPHFRMHLMPPT